METLDIKIALDPVNDGAVLKETKLKRKDEGALIIATNGESRIVDAYEAQEILDKLNDIGHGEYMGDSDYIAMMNGDKIINIGTGKEVMTIGCDQAYCHASEQRSFSSKMLEGQNRLCSESGKDRRRRAGQQLPM